MSEIQNVSDYELQQGIALYNLAEIKLRRAEKKLRSLAETGAPNQVVTSLANAISRASYSQQQAYAWLLQQGSGRPVGVGLGFPPLLLLGLLVGGGALAGGFVTNYYTEAQAAATEADMQADIWEWSKANLPPEKISKMLDAKYGSDNHKLYWVLGGVSIVLVGGYLWRKK